MKSEFNIRVHRVKHLILLGGCTLVACGTLHGAEPPVRLDHPRLFFVVDDLPRLRALRAKGKHAEIWKNLADSADWCLTRKPRTKWIAPVSPDPIYLNLYDRFYGMMHDMAIMEHLAFAYAYCGDDRYFDGARRWTLACCRVWRREADGKPDPSKAYAVTRILKGVAVSYDLLHNDLPQTERKEIRDTLVEIGRKYYRYFQDPAIAGPGHNKHHGSVEAASFGLLALALLGEVTDAKDWLDLMIRKHTGYLLPQGLTPGGTQEQTSNFWASTMQYRIFFMDALRRVTGRDLFREHAKHMSGRIALAAVAGPKPRGLDEDNQSVLFGPSYGQLNYWSPVLLSLAREYRRSTFQHLALWDASLGAIQKTRYVTPNGEQLLFHLGGYAYAWYAPDVPDRIEPDLPLSFEFLEVNEAYVRASYRPGSIVAGIRLGTVVVHAGGRPVLIESYDVHHQPKSVPELALTDDGKTAVIRCTQQTIELKRPDVITLSRKTTQDVRWWCHGPTTHKANTLTWPDGTRLKITRGNITSFDPNGYRDEKVVGMGKLKLADPKPMRYPLITARPENGELIIQVNRQKREAGTTTMKANAVLPASLLLLLPSLASHTVALAQMPDPPGQIKAGQHPKHEAYLFAHMIAGDYGRLYYSVSLDGLHWTILNGGKRVFKDYRGHPDICRGHDERYYLVGNRGDDQPDINFWGSRDLIAWKKYSDYVPDLKRIPDYPRAMARIGAPKMFYDEASAQYLVTWHTTHHMPKTNLPEPYWAGQRTIYATSKDLKTFSEPPRKLFDWDMATIDVIIRRQGQRYYAILKDERYPTLDWTTGKTIRICSSPKLLGPYSAPAPPVSPGFREAPTVIPSPDGNAWYLYYEQYPGVAYGLSVAASLAGPWFQAAGGTPRPSWNKYSMPAKARHGSMIPISHKQYNALVAAFGKNETRQRNAKSDRDK